MRFYEYNTIVKCIQQFPLYNCIKKITVLFPQHSEKTLGSIFSQQYQRKMKKIFYKHCTEEKMEEYYLHYLTDSKIEGSQHVLLKLSQELDIPPSFLARLVLQQHLVHAAPSEDNDIVKSLVSSYLKDTCLIEDPRLACEIEECILSDDVYGPMVDNVKHVIGLEYELVLKEKLRERDLAFLGEDQLRVKGYDKTPDVKLEVPIAVDGHVVNWIESKGSFGDEVCHETYLKEQYWSYWNRFGPGLVIYWFGFIDELDVNRDKGILLMDHFPDEILTMNP